MDKICWLNFLLNFEINFNKNVNPHVFWWIHLLTSSVLPQRIWHQQLFHSKSFPHSISTSCLIFGRMTAVAVGLSTKNSKTQKRIIQETKIFNFDEKFVSFYFMEDCCDLSHASSGGVHSAICTSEIRGHKNPLPCHLAHSDLRQNYCISLIVFNLFKSCFRIVKFKSLKAGRVLL